MSLRIAMWSGPRNLSTAMMYAFRARGDCRVSDEPYYAAYLAQTGLDHPLRAAILASQPVDPQKVVLDTDIDSPIWYQKHMTQHMLPQMPRGWMTACRHAFLIRHPARVIASYARKREAPNLNDIGFVQQQQLFDHICQSTGTAPPVIDSTDIRANPGPMLQALCAALDIAYTDRMLRWPAGPKPEDGVWAPVWYQAVHRSTGFDTAEGPLPVLPAAYQSLADAAMDPYETLAAHKLTA